MYIRSKCYVCGNSNNSYDDSYLDGHIHMGCCICGQYILPERVANILDKTKEENKFNIASYLFYNKTKGYDIFIGSQQEYNEFALVSANSNVKLVTMEQIEAWYPKTFAEKVDKILLYFNKRAKDFGEIREYTYIDLTCVLMVYLHSDFDVGNINMLETPAYTQIKYYLDYLEKNDYIMPLSRGIPVWSTKVPIQISPNGYEKIYTLLKQESSNKNVFVAMKFGKDTMCLREKIKEGLEGYNVRIMDEIEHNHLIVPEMLYEIRNSRFVIAELTHHNNGAYYEAGYALGIGKDVIHLCQKEEMTNGLHFDVAQVNTIVYDNIDEIPARLKKRIEATINEI